MPHRILKSNVNEGNYDTSDDENQTLLTGDHTSEVNAEVHAAGVCYRQSSKVRENAHKDYGSQRWSNEGFQTPKSISEENIHSDDTSLMKTVNATIEIDKNSDDSTTIERKKSTGSSFELENMVESVDHTTPNSIMQALLTGISYGYNFITSMVRGDSELQGTHDSVTGDFMETKEFMAEDVEKDDFLSIPSTTYSGEHAGVEMSNDNSAPKSGEGKSTGSHISSTTTFSSSTTFKSTETNEIMGIQEPESSSDNERLATAISQLESPFSEQQTLVSRNKSRRTSAVTTYLAKCTIVQGTIAFIVVCFGLAFLVPAVMYYFRISESTCIAVGSLFLLFGVIFCLALYKLCNDRKEEKKATKSPKKVRYNRLLDTVEILDLTKVMALST